MSTLGVIAAAVAIVVTWRSARLTRPVGLMVQAVMPVPDPSSRSLTVMLPVPLLYAVMTMNIALVGLDVCVMTTGLLTDQDFPVCVVERLVSRRDGHTGGAGSRSSRRIDHAWSPFVRAV